MQTVLILIAAYLLGSIPFGYLVVRAKAGGDVRETGSGGTGATNVVRRAGKSAGVLTLLLDAGKGLLAIYLARTFLTSDHGMNWWVAAAAVLAVAGHVFPVWLGFRGGKGAATGAGVFLGLAPPAVAFAAVVFAVVVGTTRYVSLGSIVATLALPIGLWLWSALAGPIEGLNAMLTAAIIGGALIILMHRANIGRLLRGTESQFR